LSHNALNFLSFHFNLFCLSGWLFLSALFFMLGFFSQVFLGYLCRALIALPSKKRQSPTQAPTCLHQLKYTLTEQTLNQNPIQLIRDRYPRELLSSNARC